MSRLLQTWKKAFEALLELPSNGKQSIVIDKFPYLCKTKPIIPSILQKLWDTLFQNNNIIIVLFVSSMSFIENKILCEKNSLYDRSTGILKLKQMSFSDVINNLPINPFNIGYLFIQFFRGLSDIEQNINDFTPSVLNE